MTTRTAVVVTIACLVAAPLAILSACEGSEPTAADIERDRMLTHMFAAQDAMVDVLRDPDSARYSSVRAHRFASGYAFCGLVNAKNGFGGYTGAARFVAGPGVAVTDDGGGEFAKIWQVACAGAGEEVRF